MNVLWKKSCIWLLWVGNVFCYEWVGEGILCMTLYVYKTLPKMIITITTKADIALKHAHIFSWTHINAQVDGLLIIGIKAVCTINMHYIFKRADIKNICMFIDLKTAVDCNKIFKRSV